MFRANRTTSLWLVFSLVFVFLFADLAFGQIFHPGRTVPHDPPQYQIMARHLGFEDQQRAYLAKVQGASSQNVLWITPVTWPEEPRPLFRLFKRRR